MKRENTGRMMIMEKAGGTGEAECCPDLLGWSAEAERAAKSQHTTQCSRSKPFPDMLHIYSLNKETPQRKKQCFLFWTRNHELAIMHWNCYRLSGVSPIKMMKTRNISLILVNCGHCCENFCLG